MPTIAEQWLQEGREEGHQKGHEEGREEGREEGELIGKILAFQDVLGREPSQRDELVKLSIDQLKQLADELTATIKANRSR